MPNLHVFNPDTDFALAADRDYYTAPESVIKIRRKLALLPALYAKPEDGILLLDRPLCAVSCLRFYNLVLEKKLKIFVSDELDDSDTFQDFHAEPWGWNKSIRRYLIDKFKDLKGIPSETTINKIRILSHRRTAARILSFLSPYINPEIAIPREIFDVDEAIQEFKKNKYLYFKAPWSSSGRGIILTDELEVKHVEPWIRGVINKQGSVIMEKAYNRILDFATEWRMNNGNAEFIGYSIFEVSRRGKYKRNIKGSQSQLLNIIRTHNNSWNEKYLNILKSALEIVIGNAYEGLLGIDMLVTETGNLNPCVEINLRHTMGMLDLL